MCERRNYSRFLVESRIYAALYLNTVTLFFILPLLFLPYTADQLRLKRRAKRTKQTYLYWIKAYNLANQCYRQLIERVKRLKRQINEFYTIEYQRSVVWGGK